MGYSLDRKHSLSHHLSRITREELDSALDSLADATPGADAIHEARKSVKRLRAVLRLVEAELGPAGKKFTARLRTAAHALSVMREADASLETLAALRRSHSKSITLQVWRGARKGLESREQASRAHAADALQLSRAALEEVKLTAPKRVEQVARFRVVREGAVRAYRRTRRALARLTGDAGDAEFHLLRRRLKDHYYHMRLFEGLHAAPRARAPALNRLEEELGNDHNLALLADLILLLPRRYGSTQGTELLLGCIAIEQHRIRQLVLQAGAKAFEWRPREFASELTRWWKDR
jgi:CHAD domain-containing protein